MGFLGNAFRDDNAEVLFFILVFLLLFYGGASPYNNGYDCK